LVLWPGIGAATYRGFKVRLLFFELKLIVKSGITGRSS